MVADLRQSPSLLTADLAVRGLDLGDPVEESVALFSPNAARTVADLRAEHKPGGVVGARVHLQRSLDASQSVAVALDGSEGVTVGALGGVVGIEDVHGRVLLDTSETVGVPDTLAIEGLGATIRFNGEACGSVGLTGAAALREGGMGLAGPTDLSCAIKGWRLESGLSRVLIGKYAGVKTAEEFVEASPRGDFDAELNVRAAAGEASLTASGWAQPRSVSFKVGQSVLDCPHADGRITFETGVPTQGAGAASAGAAPPAHGRIEHLDLVADGWKGLLDGQWSFDGASGLVLSTSVEVHADGLPDSFRALLPASAKQAVDDAGLKIAGPLNVAGGRLDIHAPPSAAAEVGLSGELGFVDVSADAGLPIEHAIGKAVFAVRAGAAAPAPEVSLALDRVRVGGVPLTDARAVLRWPAGGGMNAQGATARCHGGRIYADVETVPIADPGAGQKPRTRLRTEAVMSGVLFAPLLADLEAGGLGGNTPRPPPEDAPPDASRGTVDARVSLTSISGDIASRRGRGAIRIANGDVLRLPVVLPLVRVSNLMFPFGDRLNYLQSTFYIDGPTAVFDEVSLLSNSIAIVGEGTVSWPELAIDLRFNSRSVRRIPIWSDVFEALRNEIVSTRITGTIAEPVVRTEPLSATRRMIGEVVRPGQGGRARPALLPEYEPAARRELERLRAGIPATGAMSR
jgi:hypothetical protein